MHIRRSAANAVALAFCALFLILGSAWIWRPGIQTDEALFAAGIYPPYTRWNNVRAFGVELPLMVMSYVGTVKATLYRALVFPFFDTTAASVRLPALVIGAASVWLFYRLMLRLVGVRAAVAGAALLATDVLYILTIRLDWGPVAIQHLCLIGGVLGVVRHAQEGRRRWLTVGFFLFGIGLWDKALFSWWLASLGLATLVFAPRYALLLLRPKQSSVAVFAFLLGSTPLLIYNVRHHWSTFRTNAEWAPEPMSAKVRLVKETLDGSALFGNIVRDEWDGPLLDPATPSERFVVALSSATGGRRETYGFVALLAALLCLPFARPVWRHTGFAVLAAGATWAQMAAVRAGGTGVHHTILLWPVPAFLIAAIFAAASRRLGRLGLPLLVAAVLVVCVSNVLVLSSFYTNMLRNGGTRAWTEAVWAAADEIRRLKPSELCVVDWGFFETIRLLHRGETALCVADDPVTEDARKYALIQIADPGRMFISHTEGNEMIEGATKRLQDFAAGHGYRVTDLRIYKDFNGRSMVQTFRFEPR